MRAEIGRRRRWTPGRVLIAGFGGLLILMVIAGVDALLVLHQAKTTNGALRNSFLARSRALEQIRAGIYVSGTLARDYLLATQPAEAAAQRAKLKETEKQTDAALDRYSRSLSIPEAGAFRSLLAEIHTYWKVLDFMLDPDRAVEHRRSATYFYNRSCCAGRRCSISRTALPSETNRTSPRVTRSWLECSTGFASA